MLNELQETIVVDRVGDNGQVESFPVSLERGEQMGGGAVGVVSRMRISRDEDGDSMTGVYKEFKHSSARKIDHAKEVVSRLKKGENSSEYTIPEVLFTEKGLLMTDLSQGGKNLVISSTDSEGEVLRKLGEALEINPNFLDAFLKTNLRSKEWEQEYMSRAEVIAGETAAEGVGLTGDSIFFVLFPDGDYRTIVGDFDNVNLVEPGLRDVLEEDNLEILTRDLPGFLRNLWLKERRRRQE